MKKNIILLTVTAMTIGLVLSLSGCGSKESGDSQEVTPSTSSNEEQPPTTPPAESPTDLPIASGPLVEETTTNDSPTREEAVANQTSTTNTDSAQPNDRVADFEPEAGLSTSIQALKALDSYRYTTVMKYENTTDSATESETTTVVGEYVAPGSYHLTITHSTQDDKEEFIKIDESLWVYDDGDWMKVPENVASSFAQTIFALALDFVWTTLATNLEDATYYVGKEILNNTSTLHYSSTSSYWQEMVGESYGQGQGDIWIAEEGYPVKFMFIASGNDEQGNSGSIEWTSNVTDVNSNVTISPPATE